MLAACDRELIGKVLEENGIQLDLARHSRFYRGDLCTEEELLSKIPLASSLNLVGRKAVAAGMKSGLFFSAGGKVYKWHSPYPALQDLRGGGYEGN